MFLLKNIANAINNTSIGKSSHIQTTGFSMGLFKYKNP